MSIDRLWERFQQGADPTGLSASAGDAVEEFYLAVLCYAAGKTGEAARHARSAARHAPASRLYQAATRYLGGAGGHGASEVYLSPAAFEAFIGGGGNVRLYDELRQALRDRYQRYRPEALLDIGTGDGTALLPALTGDGSAPLPTLTGDIGRVDVVEPSRPLLDTTTAALRERGVPYRDFNGTFQDLSGPETGWHDAEWVLAQATFSLHTVPPESRAAALSWLRRRTRRLLVAEFDVSPRRPGEPGWFRYVTARYERGLAEYDGDGGLVAQGFLMPVMFGYVDPAVRHYEQSVTAWVDDLRTAGFTDVAEPALLYDYWWAPAYLLEASA